VADVEKILRLVSEGVLTPEEADEILSATDSAGSRTTEQTPPTPPAPPTPPTAEKTGSRHLRIEVSEGGRRVVNLRVPINIAGWASAILPGLSDEDSNRIRSAVASGIRGPIVDIGTDDGDRVLIVSE
jgi:SHOCT-like protein